MPVVNGIECLEEIIKNPITVSIPVVIISSDTARAELALSLGASAYIEKVSDRRYFHQKIAQAIDKYAAA